MSNDLNLCQFIGRLGRDPETRYTSSGDAVVNLSIACGWKSKDKEGTEWVRAVAFGKLAEICGQYLRKGSQVYVSGRMQTRKWQDKDGSDRYATEIMVDRMQMLGSKEGQHEAPQKSPQQRATEAQAPANFDDMGDDIPF